MNDTIQSPIEAAKKLANKKATDPNPDPTPTEAQAIIGAAIAKILSSQIQDGIYDVVCTSAGWKPSVRSYSADVLRGAQVQFGDRFIARAVSVLRAVSQYEVEEELLTLLVVYANDIAPR